MAKTKIEWTGTPTTVAMTVQKDIKVDGKVFLPRGAYPAGAVLPGFTFNGWKGCERRSRACKNCYAEAWAERVGFTENGHHHLKIFGPAKTTPRVRTAAAYWKKPHRWNELARSLGVRLKVFAFSLADVGEQHPMVEPWRAEFFDLVDATPHLDWLLLSKRDLGAVWPKRWREAAPPNVWAGATVEDQDAAMERIPALKRVNARVRWLSCEPLCGPLGLDPPLCQYCEPEFGEIVEGDPPWCVRCDSEAVFGHWLDPLADEDQPGVNWVVAGGESGPGHEVMDLDWLRHLRATCAQRGVAFFVKQDSGPHPGRQGRIPADLWAVKQWPEVRG